VAHLEDIVLLLRRGRVRATAKREVVCGRHKHSTNADAEQRSVNLRRGCEGVSTRRADFGTNAYWDRTPAVLRSEGRPRINTVREREEVC
jgi:hypothetical protein